ncbi:hypothetical protein P9A16_32665 [Shinella sp. 838]|uniref:hypothetical protein n=1 Tax=Shinella sp. 838 TaxID=3038164 RepID=UPI00241547E4|nr:hypothetical protein [Shinella sp. 838]MDG4675855.1 hypothetical protein [Shinella sp. 838]
MRMIRSLIYAGLALAAMALTMSAPAVAATPTDPGIYEAVKASIDAPAILQVHEDAVALTCEAPAATLSRADGRSSFPGETMNVADAAGSRLHFVEVRRRC